MIRFLCRRGTRTVILRVYPCSVRPGEGRVRSQLTSWETFTRQSGFTVGQLTFIGRCMIRHGLFLDTAQWALWVCGESLSFFWLTLAHTRIQLPDCATRGIFHSYPCSKFEVTVKKCCVPRPLLKESDAGGMQSPLFGSLPAPEGFGWLIGNFDACFLCLLMFSHWSVCDKSLGDLGHFFPFKLLHLCVKHV